MKKLRIFYVTLVLCLLSFCGCGSSENAELQKQMEELQKQNEELSARLEQMENVQTVTTSPIPTIILSSTETTVTATPESTVTPVLTNTPTTEPTMVPEETLTPTPEPTATCTPIPTPTITPLPTNTPTPSPSPTPLLSRDKSTYTYDVTYEMLARYPDKYIDKPVKFTGTVTQVLPDNFYIDGYVTIRMDANNDSEQNLLVIFKKEILDGNILEDDYITIYAGFVGLQTYETIFEEEITVPLVCAVMLDIHNVQEETASTPTPIPVVTTLELPDLSSKEYSYYSSSGKRWTSMRISDITYEIEENRDGSIDIKLYFSGEKTYDYEDSTNSCSAIWKLYDEDGYVVDSDNVFVSDLGVGDKFRNKKDYIYSLPAGGYRLEIYDDGKAIEGAENGYGQVKGQITWQYNDYVGTRGDSDATVMLIPENDDVKTYDNGLAALLIKGTYDSGIIVKKCDGYGNFDFGDRIPTGKYKVVVISENTIGSARFNDEDEWIESMSASFEKYFSDADLESFLLAVGFSKIATTVIEVENNRVNTITHDFGNTYIK